MKAQVNQLQNMSETLESSGFSRHQSDAVIESVALAMETFAVTPEILETRLKEHTEQILKVIRGRDEDINDLQTNMRHLQTNMGNLQTAMLNLQNSMLTLQRSVFRMMIAIMTTLIATALALFGTLAT